MSVFKRMLGSLDSSSTLSSSKCEAPEKSLERGQRATQIGSNEPRANGHCNGSLGEQLRATARSETPSETQASGATPKRSLSKRGRKKLASMMNKLNSSFRSSSLSKSNPNRSAETGARQSNGDDVDQSSDLASDSDEEYSEPLCQDAFDKLEPEQQAEILARTRSSSLVNKGSLERRHSSYDDDDGDNRGELMAEEQCDIPTFRFTKNCDKQLIETTRLLLRERFAKNPDSFYADDYRRMLEDDWTVSRFLLRRRCDPKRTAKLMEECGRFRKQYKMSEVKLWEFPTEFHKAGGLFKYAPDRVGNRTVYMRVKMYRRVPEISDVFKAFILCVLEEADVESEGRGVAVVFDLSGCGLQNVDLSFLSWLLSSFRNYCPKGVSYILVYNLPWILSTTCRIAMTWMSATNRRALRFVHGDEIENFIAKENLPDYCGGTCKLNYRTVPEGSRPAIEVCSRLDITPEQALKIRELFKEYLSDDDGDDEDDNEANGDHAGGRSKGKNKSKSHKQHRRQESKADWRDANFNVATTKNCDTLKESSQISVERTQNGRQDIASTDFVSEASKFIA